MKSVLAKLRSEYRNLNIDNIGLSAEGIGGYSVIRTLYGLSEDWQDDIAINVNCTLLASPITNLKTNGKTGLAGRGKADRWIKHIQRARILKSYLEEMWIWNPMT